MQRLVIYIDICCLRVASNFLDDEILFANGNACATLELVVLNDFVSLLSQDSTKIIVGTDCEWTNADNLTRKLPRIIRILLAILFVDYYSR